MIEKSFIMISKKKKYEINQTYKSKLIIYVVLLIFINSFLGVKNLEADKYNKKLSQATNVNAENKITKDTSTTDMLKKFDNKFQPERLNIENILVNRDSVEMLIRVENKKECLDIIRRLEKIYKINSISPIIEENDKKLIKVILC